MDKLILLLIVTLAYSIYGQNPNKGNNGPNGEKTRCKVDFVANHMKLNVESKANQVCEECMTKYNLTISSIRSVENKSGKTPPTAVKCYYACYFKTYGSMDQDGNFLPTAVEDDFSKKNIDAAVACIPDAMKYEDHCDRAYSLYRCYIGKPIDSLKDVSLIEDE